MKQYIGTKLVKAEPQMKNGKEGYKVVYQDDYTSWSPKAVFEEAYRDCEGMTFGIALELLKKGVKIARADWNEKGIFVVYQKGYPEGIPCNKQTADAWGIKEGDLFKCNPYLQIKQADGSHSMWFPTIGDVLAEDWVIVE